MTSASTTCTSHKRHGISNHLTLLLKDTWAWRQQGDRSGPKTFALSSTRAMASSYVRFFLFNFYLFTFLHSFIPQIKWPIFGQQSYTLQWVTVLDSISEYFIKYYSIMCAVKSGKINIFQQVSIDTVLICLAIQLNSICVLPLCSFVK